jgi:hypothetical protein
MSDKKPTICPICDKETLYRIYSISISIDSKEPKTIGELADKNTERMVKEGKLTRGALSHKENKKKRKKQQEKMDKITKMSPKQQANYIATGKM